MAEDKSIKYLKSLKDDDLLYDSFIISYLGILGLYKINEQNNLLRLQLKKYRQVLNHISDDSIDVYWQIQNMFDNKQLKIQTALSMIDVYQRFRDPDFKVENAEEEIKSIMEKIPQRIFRRFSGNVKFWYKAYIGGIMSLTKLVNKFYSYAMRKQMTDLDFYTLAKKMKRVDNKEETNVIT